MANRCGMLVLAVVVCLAFTFTDGLTGTFGGGSGLTGPFGGGSGLTGPFGGGSSSFGGRPWCTCRPFCYPNEVTLSSTCRLFPIFPWHWNTCCRWLPFGFAGGRGGAGGITKAY